MSFGDARCSSRHNEADRFYVQWVEIHQSLYLPDQCVSKKNSAK